MFNVIEGCVNPDPEYLAAMREFRRLFKYIWPQWPRLVFVVFGAMTVAALLSLSFLTIIPLLKITMEEEGLHGWLNAKACVYRYGIEFSPPGIYGSSPEALVVSRIVQDGLARAAGLHEQDHIIRIEESDHTWSGVPHTTLLKALATTQALQIHLQVLRQTGESEAVQLHTPMDKDYIRTLPWGYWKARLTRWATALVDKLQGVAALIPSDRSKAATTKAVIFIITAIMIMTLIRCLSKYCQDYYAEQIVQLAINDLRQDVFAHLTHIPMSYFSDRRPSDCVSRIVRDTNEISLVLKVLFGKALREPLNALFLLGCALLVNWQLTLIFMGASPFVLILMVRFSRSMKKATTKSLVAGSQMLGKLEETLASLKVVKIYNQQSHEQAAFARINQTLLKQHLKMAKVDAATSPAMEVIGMAACSAAILIGIHWVTRDRSSEFIGLLLLLGFSADAVRRASDLWNKIPRAYAASERVLAILDQPAEVDALDAVPCPPLRKGMTFENVNFTYPGRTKPVLKDVSLTIPAGHNVALVGPNGSGKTTLANLIPRFYDPDSGRILIDGLDLRKVTLASLRDQIGLVTQHLVTFNDTVANNIAYGRPGATPEQIREAARRAYAHEFIVDLPKGYDTVIGEHGAGLSGGQLQRIVIARAILKNPALLIFDEATSQIDADSESKIHSAIKDFMADRTTLIIAHRFSTVVSADVIVVMDEGRIVAHGHHEELIQTCRLYETLYQTQLIKA